MNAYQPPIFDSPIDLDLSRNEGRPGLSRVDIDAATMAALVGRYPDTSRLTDLIARRHGVSTGQVLPTAGGDDALFRCILRGGGPVVTTSPTFEMIRRYTAQSRRKLVEVPWWSDDLPVAEILDIEAELAVIVSPNNPTGSVIGETALRKVADAFPSVILDAAYAEFADEDLTALALELGNVVVIRTLSKAFGLAGLRVGYGLGPEALIVELAGYGSPFALSGLSAHLGAEALQSGLSRVDGYVRRIREERSQLTEVLSELGTRPLPSRANFVLATDVDAEWLVSAAASWGIGLRHFPQRPELSRCVRIGLPGDRNAFARLLDVLNTALRDREVADATKR